MYVERLKNKSEDGKEKKIDEFFSEEKEELENEEDYARDVPNNKYLENARLHWLAPEHEIYERDSRWYLYVALVLAAIVAYAVYTNSPVMAITFVLIGVVGYIFANKQPRIIDFAITHDGVIAGRDLYEFDNVKSFWIFYEPGNIKVVSLHMKNKLMPFVHIPVHDQDPVAIREILLEYIPEEKQDPSIVDTFERLLGI